jgi:hypothetical protein
MKAIELCPPKHLDAAMLGGKDCVVTIKSVAFTEVGEGKEKKGALVFNEFEQPMVINRTNIKRLIKKLGGDTDTWIAKQVTLYPSECDYKGETVSCIRVRESS